MRNSHQQINLHGTLNEFDLKFSDGWSVVTFPSLSVCLDKLDDFRVIVPDGDETGFAVVKLENDEMKFEEADGN